MRQLAFFLMISLVLPISSVAQADAYGLKKGQQKDALRNARHLRKFAYEFTPSKPHPGIEMYVAMVSPKSGVCGVFGAAGENHRDRRGKRTRDVFDRLEREFSERYGPPLKEDRLNEGSALESPDQWVESIAEKERTYRSTWFKGRNPRLPSDLEEIRLTVLAFAGESFVEVRHHFTGYDNCKIEIEDHFGEVF